MNGIISIKVGFIYIKRMKLTLRKTNGAIKNAQSRDTCDMRYIRHRKKTKKNKKPHTHNATQKTDKGNQEWTIHRHRQLEAHKKAGRRQTNRKNIKETQHSKIKR